MYMHYIIFFVYLFEQTGKRDWATNLHECYTPIQTKTPIAAFPEREPECQVFLNFFSLRHETATKSLLIRGAMWTETRTYPNERRMSGEAELGKKAQPRFYASRRTGFWAAHFLVPLRLAPFLRARKRSNSSSPHHCSHLEGNHGRQANRSIWMIVRWLL